MAHAATRQSTPGYVSARVSVSPSQPAPPGSDARVYDARTGESDSFDEEEPMKQTLQALLCFVCAAHVVIGLGLNLVPGFPPLMAGIYGATVDWTPQFTYILKPLGAFMLTVGLLAGVAATNPIRYAPIVYAVAVLFVIRSTQRLVFASESSQAFGITLARDVAVASFFLALALALFVLVRRAAAGANAR
jgi:hypothetical protein